MTKMLLAAALALFIGATVQAKPVRYVFKGQSRLIQSAAPRFTPMTFGLSNSQISAIQDLTAGHVDFSGYYSTLADDQAARLFGRMPDYLEMHGLDVPPPGDVTQIKPADPELDGQWWFKNLHVSEAWTHATGMGVTIADCDAGIYFHEPDLAANVLSDLRHDFADPKDPTNVEDGGYTYHGTAVAAIMVGVRDLKGTNGIAFNSKLVPFQNFNYDGKDMIDKEEATAACVLQAIKTPGVSIIVLENQTMSGSSETFLGTRDAVRLAINSGVIVVGAGGNASVELLAEAKDDTGSIIVGAVNPGGVTEKFSNYGARTTIAAYGEQLHTLYGPNGIFGSFGGTSGATPQVAATVALMKEAHPFLTPQQARETLVNIRAQNNDNKSVGGLLDVEKAVLAAKVLPSDVPQWTGQQLFRSRLSAILSR